MPMIDEATRNDSIPMSRNRCSAETESVACTDERTRWPVRADCTPMRAVSTSRISPQDGAQPGCEGHACLLVGLNLVDRWEHVLHRILDRHDVSAGVTDLGE